MRSILASIALLASILMGCDTTLQADDYERRCTEDDECTVVYEGDVCEECGQSNAAIHRDDRPRYGSDLQTLQGLCLIKRKDFADCDGCLLAKCIEGRCEISCD